MVFATLLSLLMLWRYTRSGVVGSVVVGQWIFHNTVGWTAGGPSDVHHHAPIVPVLDESTVVMGGAHFVAAALTAGAVFGADRGIAAIARAGAIVWRAWVWGIFTKSPWLPVCFQAPAGANDVVWVTPRDATRTPRTLRGPPVLSFS
ncbi:MAG: hypothetical protein WD400_03300 [Pontimonas sp.]